MDKQDDFDTIVLFRADHKKPHEVTAIFPEVPSDYEGYNMMCYAHVGQHGGCSQQFVWGTRPAKPDEYASLKTELEQIGYRLIVRQRISPQMRSTRFAEAKRLRTFPTKKVENA